MSSIPLEVVSPSTTEPREPVKAEYGRPRISHLRQPGFSSLPMAHQEAGGKYVEGQKAMNRHQDDTDSRLI